MFYTAMKVDKLKQVESYIWPQLIYTFAFTGLPDPKLKHLSKIKEAP